MQHLAENLITKDDIANIAVNEQLILDDKDRISLLEAMHSIDVQACPGSGKTTLIATKLILLSKKWSSQHQGICVLSHTNVAKDEIISRIKQSNTIEAKRLLSYPHFIGTIQEFVNRFIALPYIRSKGVKDITINNDEYTKIARNVLDNHFQFSWLRGSLNGLGNSDSQAAFLRTTYRFISQNEEVIHISRKPRAWQQDSGLRRAKRALGQLKKYLDNKGVYLFRDMYTHAQLACLHNSELRKSISRRFPYLFLDEMQDTQKYQDELLNEVFPSGESSIIVQRFGDPDQAIFNGIGSDQSNQSFNEKSREAMDFVINKTHRFDNFLADKIKLFSFNEIPLESEFSEEVLRERTTTHSTGENFEHTIILFDDDTRNNVIESFAQIVSEQFAVHHKNSDTFLVKALGAVGKEIDPNADQLRIGHYWLNYDKNKTKVNFKATSLVEAIRYCRQTSSNEWAESYKFILECILTLMKIAGKRDEDERYFSSTNLREKLKNDGTWEEFRKTIYLMLENSHVIDQRFCRRLRRKLIGLLELHNVSEETANYLAFSEEEASTNMVNENISNESDYLASLPDNKISHSDGFQIELSTIHSVKGETHDATLIVETKNHTFDFETMLSYLTGDLPSDEHQNRQLPDKPNSRRAFKPNKVFMRQFYVAMSRPKYLLCLALHKERISVEQKTLLREKGWKII